MNDIKNEPIVFITHQFKTGGVESVFTTLAGMFDRTISLIIIKENIDSDIFSRLPPNVELISRGMNEVSPLGLFRYSRRLKRNFNFSNCTIINFSDTLSSLLLLHLLPSSKKISWIHCNPEALLHSRSFMIYKYLLRKCDEIVCLCESQKKLAIQTISNIQEKIVIVPNIVNQKDICRLSEESVALTEPYLLMVSRFDFRTKDFFTLIDAYSLLDPSLLKKYKLVLLGDGPDFSVVKRYIHERNLDSNIMLPGRDVNPFKWMKHSSLFVLSSLSEGFSMVILEAMTLGIPIIASDCKVGPSDILNAGEYGVLFKPGNIEQLKCSIEKILSSEDELRKYSRLSVVRAEQIKDISHKALSGVFK